MKCLRYGIPPETLKEHDILTPFELCYHNLKNININENAHTKTRFTNKFAKYAYSYLSNYDIETERNLTEAEWKGLMELKSDRSIVVLKADKGNCVVLLKREDYVGELETLLSDKKGEVFQIYKVIFCGLHLH